MRTRSFRPPPLKLHLDTKMPVHSPITSHFQGRFTTQVRRVLPVYLLLLFLFLFFANSHFFTAPIRAAHKYKRELRYQQPLQSSTSVIPRKIWQTWKIDPLLFGITETARAMTWVKQNPQMRYEVITDASDLTYVEQHFGPDGFNRPDIVEFYRRVNLRIIKAGVRASEVRSRNAGERKRLRRSTSVSLSETTSGLRKIRRRLLRLW